MISINFNLFPNLESISESFKGILLDAYGVFWNGNSVGLLPGTKEAMEKMVKSGKFLGILSNSTQLAYKEVDKLKSHGLIEGKHFHFLITSGEVAKHFFINESLPFACSKKKFWLFGGVHPIFSSHPAIFEDSPYTETQDILEADFIYISVPHINGVDQTNPNLFREEINKIKDVRLPIICTNPDRFAHEGNPPRAVVRQGSIAAMFEELGGQVFYIGKPSKMVYSAAMKEFAQYEIFNPQEVLMVGDTPETDIRGAQIYGMPSALVTRTGIMADRILQQGLENAIKGLSPNDFPDFFIERLA